MELLLIVVAFALLLTALGRFAADSRDTSYSLWAGPPHALPPSRGSASRSSL